MVHSPHLAMGVHVKHHRAMVWVGSCPRCVFLISDIEISLVVGHIGTDKSYGDY